MRILRALEKLEESGDVEILLHVPPLLDDTAERAALTRVIAVAGETVARIKDGYDAGIYDGPEATVRIAAQTGIRDNAKNRLVEMDASQEQASREVPPGLQSTAQTVCRELLMDATEEFETVEETTEFRAKITAQLSRWIARIEVDAPRIRIYVRPAAPTGL